MTRAATLVDMELLNRARSLALRPWRSRRATLLDQLADQLDGYGELHAADVLRSLAAQTRLG